MISITAAPNDFVLLNIKKNKSRKKYCAFFSLTVCHLFLNNSVPKEKSITFSIAGKLLQRLLSGKNDFPCVLSANLCPSWFLGSECVGRLDSVLDLSFFLNQFTVHAIICKLGS